jgi:hypothetical protein
LASAEELAGNAAGALQDAARAVTSFAKEASAALELTAHAQAGLQSALAEAQRLTGSLDLTGLLAELARVGDAVALVETTLAGYADAAAKSAAKLGRQLAAAETARTDAQADFERRFDARLADLELSAQRRHAELAAALGSVAGSNDQRLSGIVDVLPKRSRKRLGLG